MNRAGEANGRAKITAAVAEFIRRSSWQTSDLAWLFSISTQQVRRIVTGKFWKEGDEVSCPIECDFPNDGRIFPMSPDPDHRRQQEEEKETVEPRHQGSLCDGDVEEPAHEEAECFPPITEG